MLFLLEKYGFLPLFGYRGKGKQDVGDVSKTFHNSRAHVWLRLYQTYIRPMLEYNTTVLTPILKGDIGRIESIPKRRTNTIYLLLGQ